MIGLTSIPFPRRAWLLAYFILWIPRDLTAAKIGVMPAPAMSHYLYMRNIASQLLALDHHVTMIVPEYITDMTGQGVPGMDRIVYHCITSEYLKKMMDQVAELSYKGQNPMSILKKHLRELNGMILRDDDLYKHLQGQNFDLFIGHSFFASHALSVLPYRLGIPYVLVGLLVDPWTPSIPTLPSFVPHLFSQFTDKMTLYERMLNLFLYATVLISNRFTRWNDVADFAPEMPSMTVERLVGYAQLWIIDSHVLMGYAQPTMPNVKFIGGLGISPTQPLHGPLKHFMNNAGEGVVLVSFGSLLPVTQQHVEKLLEAFKSLPYKIVWRVDDVQNSYDHIYTNKWIPQNDLLAHNNTKVFVTHCGNAGQFEALYHGVPMLGIPLSSDQHHNAIRMVNRGYGIALDFASVTSDQLVTAIAEIMTNVTYKENIKRASAAYHSELRGELPSAKAAFWVDHVIKHGGAYMRSAGQDMTWCEYLLVDVVAIFLVCSIIVVIVSIRLTRAGYRIMLQIYGKTKQD